MYWHQPVSITDNHQTFPKRLRSSLPASCRLIVAKVQVNLALHLNFYIISPSAFNNQNTHPPKPDGQTGNSTWLKGGLLFCTHGCVALLFWIRRCKCCNWFTILRGRERVCFWCLITLLQCRGYTLVCRKMCAPATPCITPLTFQHQQQCTILGLSISWFILQLIHYIERKRMG